MLAKLGPVIVGSIVLLAGIAKTLPPKDSVYRLSRWGVGNAAIIVVLPGLLGLEMAMGVLIASNAFSWTPILAVALCGLFAVATVIEMRQDASDECGCYGAWFAVTKRQSLVLDAVYVALLVPALLDPPARLLSISHTLALATFAAVIGSVVTFAQLRHWIRKRRVLWDFSPLRVGVRWRSEWLPAGVTIDMDRPTIIMWLSSRCRACDSRLPAIRAAVEQQGWPVLVLATVAPTEVERVRHDKNLPGSVIAAKGHRMLSRLNLIPTLVVVEHGRVAFKGEGEEDGAFGKWMTAQSIRSHGALTVA